MYIITAESKELFDAKGKSLGESEKRGVFFSPGTGRRRLYRSPLNNPSKGFKLLSFKRKENAENIANMLNREYNDNFKVEETE